MSGSGISWAICKSASSCRQITMPVPHHSSFLQAGCPSCHPTNSVKALKALLVIIHCVPKSEPPKHYATAAANLHRFKWNFTHTRRHLFSSSTSNFIRIPYSVYEMFNSFKLLSQISVTDTTYFLLTSSVTLIIWKNDWLKSGVILIKTLLTKQWISGVMDCITVYARKGTLRTSDLNILTVLTDINCDGNSWVVGNVI